jgi:ABC-type multidrug transport system fused ATPase/permease subunit
MDVDHYRRNLALVSQEPKLFNKSIAENIVYGMERDVTNVW